MAESGQQGAPDPGKAADLAEFIVLLGELRIWAGQPSYRVLAKRVGPLLRPARTVSPFTVVDAFKVARRRLDLDLVVGIVRALGLGEDEVDRWRKACVRVHACAKTGGPTGALRQLPADLATFTGRSTELEALLAAAVRPRADNAAATVVISAIEGMAGVGKTQLALHAAHRLVRDGRYQDVQLYVNLRGFDPESPPIDPAAVLDSFLRHLEVPAQQIPDGLDERAAMFRDRINGKSALIILDNAADEQQVRPLVPSSPSCLVLITSRRSLIELDDAVVTQLDVFDQGDAVSLLTRIVGAERVAAEPEAAEAVVEACGYLPLAVALVAARLRSRPSWSLAYLMSRLRKHGVDAVGTQPLQDVFDLSYGGLDSRTQRLFRLLALHPGQDFTAPAAAALAELGEAESELLLEYLQDEHLVQQQTPGRYALHDLLHAYASGLAQQEHDEERNAVERVLSWYLASVDAAAQQIMPARYTLPLELPPMAAVPAGFDGSAEAMAWCDQEYANLLAAAERAAGIPGSDLAWRLATSMSMYLLLRCHLQETLHVHELGLESALAGRHLAGEAWVRSNLGICLAALGRPESAAPQLTRALEVRRELGDVSGEAATLSNLARVLVESGELEAGLDCSMQALAAAGRAGDRKREGTALNSVAICLWELKRPLEALDYLHRKLAMHREDRDAIGLGLALHNIAEFHETLQQYDEALQVLREAQHIASASGDLHAEAGALFGIARCLSATGQHQAARPDLERALAVFEKLKAPELRDARELLTRITELTDDEE
ncbi:tetratricopeptide (TPR) repeat protein [Kitasatospora sp. GP30]|uniref:tetratricopeptide repeat protein n=1 Tax=Kitasatospora sp. GP30 TaxID=3035084 RepID=UPI000C7025D2|nr:tetratricopeptide repeat protein [Kitasatospora sp. GP30]MDH6139347.1 tetratricopeptide (TPR) repeat protein [Kitasatospora sp. GP30]